MRVLVVENKVLGIPNKTQYQHGEMLVENHRVVVLSQGEVATDVARRAERTYEFVDYPVPAFLFPFWAAVVALYYYLVGQYDTVVTGHSPQCLVVGAVFVPTGACWIADVYDHPNIARHIRGVKAGRDGGWLPRRPYTRLVTAAAVSSLKRADLIVLSMADEALSDVGIPGDAPNLLSVTNGVDVAYTRSAVAGRSGSRSSPTPFGITYVGHVTKARGIDVILDAVETLRETTDLEFELSLIGPVGSRDWLDRRIAEAALTDVVTVHGTLDHEATLAAIDEADVCLNVLSTDVWNYRYAYPIKVFEYMALGKAIVSTRTDGIEDVVDDGTTGVLLESNDPAELADRVVALATDDDRRAELGENASVAVERFDWGPIRERIGREIDDVCA